MFTTFNHSKIEYNYSFKTPEKTEFNSYESQELVSLTITNNHNLVKKIQAPKLILCLSDSNFTFLFSKKLLPQEGRNNFKQSLIGTHYAELKPNQQISLTYGTSFYNKDVYTNNNRGQQYQISIYQIKQDNLLNKFNTDNICITGENAILLI